MKRYLVMMVLAVSVVLATAGLAGAQTSQTYPPSPPPPSTTVPPPPIADTGSDDVIPYGTVAVVLLVVGLGVVWVARKKSL